MFDLKCAVTLAHWILQERHQAEVNALLQQGFPAAVLDRRGAANHLTPMGYQTRVERIRK